MFAAIKHTHTDNHTRRKVYEPPQCVPSVLATYACTTSQLHPTTYPTDGWQFCSVLLRMTSYAHSKHECRPVHRLAVTCWCHALKGSGGRSDRAGHTHGRPSPVSPSRPRCERFVHCVGGLSHCRPSLSDWCGLSLPHCATVHCRPSLSDLCIASHVVCDQDVRVRDCSSPAARQRVVCTERPARVDEVSRSLRCKHDEGDTHTHAYIHTHTHAHTHTYTHTYM